VTFETAGSRKKTDRPSENSLVAVILPEKSIYTGMIPVVVKIGHGSILISSSG
jgi:hypothetical protein